MQELQVALRQANDTVTAKNHELLQLNRDNVRLTEQATQQDRDLHQIRGELRQRDRDLAALNPLPAELHALKAEWTTALKANDGLREDLVTLRAAFNSERDARVVADMAAASDTARLKALEEVIALWKATEHSAGSAAAPPA